MRTVCPKCKQKFDPSRWNNFKPKMTMGDCCVCNDCLDDNIRHKILENYIGYNNVGANRKVIINIKIFNELLHYMSLDNVDEFRQWYERESSKHNLLCHSVYHEIGTASPYPNLIEAILQFIKNG